MKNKKIWVVTVDMGYGHQRAAYPFRDIAYQEIITANSSKLLSKWEIRSWKRYRTFYEWISRLTIIPIIGKFIFQLYDKLQQITEMYPKRDLSKSNFATEYCDYLIKKRKLNHSMFSHIKESNLPLLTTFFFTALAAEYAGVKKVYCIATDTDINRTWVAKNPSKSNIVYFAPTETAAKRLRLYGVSPEKIIMTGFPLPKENIGGKDMRLLKKDMRSRLINLDPKRKLPEFYTSLKKKIFGKNYLKKKPSAPTLTFSIGGAGAQIDLAIIILKSLKQSILEKKIKICIAAGTKPETLKIIETQIKKIGLDKEINKGIQIIFNWSKIEYFKEFNKIMRTTDILWTKPSELSFYSGLGIPIIIAPPIGSHEYRNQKWLIDIGAGLNQENPEYTQEWLFDLIESGKLANAAMKGFVEVQKMGTYEIEKKVTS